jgi:AAA domain
VTAPALDLDQAAEFVDFLYQEQKGYACLATRQSEKWCRQEFFFLPSKKVDLLARIRTLAPQRDVYVGTLLYSEPTRNKTTALPGRLVWTDCDHDPDGRHQEWVRKQHGVVVASGGLHRFHGYLPLNELVDSAALEELNGAFAARIGGDSKWDASAVLRVPGTLHHKDPANPKAVRWLAPPNGFEGWVPQDLRELLGAASATAPAPVSVIEAEPVRPIPGYIESKMDAEPGGDRSDQLADLVYSAVEWGYRDGEILWMAARQRAAVAKYGKRLPQETLRPIAKHRLLHQHIGQTCGQVKCKNKPGWMPDDWESTTPDRSLRTRVMTDEQLRHLPPPEPLIWGTLMRDTVAVLFGQPGAGKSFVAQDWALSLSAGQDWLGKPSHTGPALYVAGEGTSGLGTRSEAWRLAHGGDTSAMRWLPTAVNLRDREQMRELLLIVAEIEPVLIVIDTLARCLPGADENSVKDVGEAVANADRLREAAGGACVLLVHHSTKDGIQVRGSSALAGAADTMIECSRDGTLLTLRCTKQKDDAEFTPIPLQMVMSGRSVVLEYSDGQPIDLSDSRSADLRFFANHFAHDGVSKAEFRNVYIEETGSSRATAYRVLERLQTEGVVRNEGSPARPDYRLTSKGRTALANDDGRLL